MPWDTSVDSSHKRTVSPLLTEMLGGSKANWLALTRNSLTVGGPEPGPYVVAARTTVERTKRPETTATHRRIGITSTSLVRPAFNVARYGRLIERPYRAGRSRP